VEIRFISRKLEKQLTDPVEMQKRFGQLARKLNQRMKELADAQHLAVMKTIPAARCHELSGARTGELAVDVSGNYRLVFRPDHEPLPRKDDGGLNWESVNSITITAVVDYH
jgi:plasmid maintenance system killer protein